MSESKRSPSDILRIARKVNKYIKSEISYIIDHVISDSIDCRDNLVITGFWRSGTTWFQQSIAALISAKAVFEPLQPRVILSQKKFPYGPLQRKDTFFLRVYMPYCEEDFSNNPDFYNYLDMAFRSNLRGEWLRRPRRSVFDAFKNRAVIKMVRGQLCVRAIRNSFSCTVIHIYRDPRAVIASVKRNNWWSGWLDCVSLEEQLLKIKDGRDEFFQQWYEDIMKYDKEDSVSRVAAYWALTEKYVQYCNEQYSEKIPFVSYDRLHGNVASSIMDILKKTGIVLEISRAIDFDKDSPTTCMYRRKMRYNDRINSWKYELDKKEISVIESIVQNFGLEVRMLN